MLSGCVFMLLCVIIFSTSQIDVYMYKPMSASMRNGLLGWLNHIVSGIKKDNNGVCGLFWALLAGAEFVILSSSRRKSCRVEGKQVIATFLSKRTTFPVVTMPLAVKLRHAHLPRMCVFSVRPWSR